MSTDIDEQLDEDWLDKVLEQYWKQRHGMYNANQDDVEMANREAKDAIANKIVEIVLKERAAIKRLMVEAQIEEVKQFQKVLRGGKMPVVASIFDNRITTLQHSLDGQEGTE